MDYPVQSLSEIREQAKAAREAGQKSHQNPYAEGTPHHATWREAFEAITPATALEAA